MIRELDTLKDGCFSHEIMDLQHIENLLHVDKDSQFGTMRSIKYCEYFKGD